MDFPIILIIVFGFIIISHLYRRQRQKTYLRQCLQKFTNPVWQIRRDLIHEIANEIRDNPKYDPGALIQLLIHAAQDQDERVRGVALNVIAYQIGKRVRQGKGSIPAIGLSARPQVVNAFIHAITDQQPGIRKEAVAALGKLQEASALPYLLKALEDQEVIVRRVTISALQNMDDLRVMKAFIQALQDQHEDVRAASAGALKQYKDIRVIPPLLQALHDRSQRVYHSATPTLGEVCAVVRTIVFGAIVSEHVDPSQTLYNPDVTKLTVVMKKLRQLVIYADKCDPQQVETFADYMYTFYDQNDLKRHVTVTLHGDPLRFSSTAYKVWNRCKAVEVFIEILIFGATSEPAHSAHLTLCNPDFIDFTLPLPALQQVIIYTATYDFHRVERFLTYALDYIGQKQLRKAVEVHLHGDPNALHPNLYNNLKNICKEVVVMPA